MIGSIIGDIVGSRFEGMNRFPKIKNFTMFHKDSHFTDDTVMTLAISDAILNKKSYKDSMEDYYHRYPNVGYGSNFKNLVKEGWKGEGLSWGNGAAMRVSPIAWAFDTEEEVLHESKMATAPSHGSPEGIKGAQAVALAIFMLRKGSGKDDVEKYISERFEYDLRPPLNPEWDVSCQGCVPQAFCAFLESEGFEDCIRRAIFKGGDSDTIAAIAGSMAEAYYGVPKDMIDESYFKMSEDLANISQLFTKKYINPDFKMPKLEDKKWGKGFKMLIK